MLIRPFRLEMKKAHRRSRSCGFRVKCETHPRLEILQEAMRQALKDPEFHREFQKLVAMNSSRLCPRSWQNDQGCAARS